MENKWDPVHFVRIQTVGITWVIGGGYHDRFGDDPMAQCTCDDMLHILPSVLVFHARVVRTSQEHYVISMTID